jgi:hypothetical protein
MSRRKGRVPPETGLLRRGVGHLDDAVANDVGEIIHGVRRGILASLNSRLEGIDHFAANLGHLAAIWFSKAG